MADNSARYEHDFSLARMVTIAVLLGTCAMAWVFARSLYGSAGGLLSLIVVAFTPDLLAHGTGHGRHVPRRGHLRRGVGIRRIFCDGLTGLVRL